MVPVLLAMVGLKLLGFAGKDGLAGPMLNLGGSAGRLGWAGSAGLAGPIVGGAGGAIGFGGALSPELVSL